MRSIMRSIVELMLYALLSVSFIACGSGGGGGGSSSGNSDGGGDGTTTLSAPTDVIAWYWGSAGNGCTIIGKAVSGVSTYKLYSSADGTTYTDTGAVPAQTNGSMFAFDTVANQSTYFKVKATGGGQESSYSTAVYLDFAIRGQLAGLSITAPANNALVSATPTFTWTSVAGASSYVVMVENNTTEEGYALVKLSGTSWQYGSTTGVVSYLSKALLLNTTYDVNVFGLNSAGSFMGHAGSVVFTAQ